MKRHVVIDVDALAAELSGLSINWGDFDSIETAVKQIVPEVETVSKSLIKKLAQKANTFKCCSCCFVSDSIDELAVHIVKKQHKFGQNKLGSQKRELLYRIFDMDSEEEGEERRLTKPEKDLWARLFKEEELMSPAEEQTFHNIIMIECHLQRIHKLIRHYSR